MTRYQALVLVVALICGTVLVVADQPVWAIMVGYLLWFVWE